MNFLFKLAYKYRQFMMGRYGSDELNLVLVVFSAILLFLSRIKYMWFLYFISLLIFAFAIIRMYSRNIGQRHNEKMFYLKIKNKIMDFYRIKRDSWKYRKTHKYFRCKTCKASIRVPRGVGKIQVTCPKCKAKVIKKV